MSDIILEMRNITKTFPGVKALDNVNLAVAEAEIHALVGENGAGKSTLMKVLSGVYPHGSYEGDIVYRGRECRFKNISDSEKTRHHYHPSGAGAGAAAVDCGKYLFGQRARAPRRHRPVSKPFPEPGDLLRKVGLNEAPDTLVTGHRRGQTAARRNRQGTRQKVRLLILDEPTASLNETDSEALLELLLEFKAQGIASILISHNTQTRFPNRRLGDDFA